MSPRGIITSAAAVLIVTAAASDVLAFCRSTTCTGDCVRDELNCKTEGAPLFWPGLCVSFSLQRDGSEFIDFAEFLRVAEASVAAWSDIDCGDGVATISFAQKANVECHKAEYNVDGPNANIVMFQDTKWAYTGVDNTLAKTTVTYDTDTGEILDADIELNHANNEFSTGDENVIYDLQSILTHEFGHFIGLDHTDDFSGTMNAGYQEGSAELRSLEPDDEAAVCAVYPASREVTCRTEPNGGFTDVCPDAVEEESCSVASEEPSSADTSFGGLIVATCVAAGGLRRARRQRVPRGHPAPRAR